MNYRPAGSFGFDSLPPVIKNLLIINGLFFLATFAFEQSLHLDLTRLLGLHHWKSEYFRVWQVATHFFMHGNLMHIFFNMFALWMFGRILENVWGPKRFLIYYIVTALGAAVIYLLYATYDLGQLQNDFDMLVRQPAPEYFFSFIDNNVPLENMTREYQSTVNNVLQLWRDDPDNQFYAQKAIELSRAFMDLKVNMPVVGASGAVFGVLLAFGMMFPNTELFLIFPPIPIKAKYFVIGYGAIELYMGIQNNPADNVAHFAHLGGMLFGYILIKFWQKRSNRFY